MKTRYLLSFPPQHGFLLFMFSLEFHHLNLAFPVLTGKRKPSVNIDQLVTSDYSSVFFLNRYEIMSLEYTCMKNALVLSLVKPVKLKCIINI